MKTCANCKIEFEEDVVFCPRCGRKVVQPIGERGDGMADVHQLVIEANLLRIRGQFDIAVDKCTQALELDPQNAEVHSLLGRIYQDKGDVDNAVRWFQMSLDIDPANKADHDALNSLLVKQAKLRAVEATAARSEDESWYDRLWKSSRFRSFLGYAILAFFTAALVFIAGSLLALLLRLQVGNVASPEPEVQAPSQQRPQITQPPTAPPPSSIESAPPVRPMAEEQLLAQIKTYRILTERGITTEDITLDPRKRSATVTFRLQKANPTQAELLTDAALLSSVIFVARPEINDLDTRAVASLPDEYGSQQWTLAFVGDIARSRATALDITKAAPYQIERAFTSTYFHGEVKK